MNLGYSDCLLSLLQSLCLLLSFYWIYVFSFNQLTYQLLLNISFCCILSISLRTISYSFVYICKQCMHILYIYVTLHVHSINVCVGKILIQGRNSDMGKEENW